jgi:predicted PurR-regulated permease PerM
MILSESPVLRFLVGAAGLVVIVAGLKAASVFFLPLLLALFLTILSLPLLAWLRRRRVPAVLAIVLTMLVVVAVLGVVGLVISLSIEDLGERMPEYQAQVRDAAGRAIDWLEDRRVAVPRQIDTEGLDLGAMANLVGGAFRGVATALSSFLLVLLMMVFMLWEAVILPGKLRVAERWGPVDLERWQPIVQRVQRYLVLKTAVSLATGVAAGVLVWLVGLDFALFWGFLAFLLNYVPNVGSFVAAIPPVILSGLQLGLTRTVVIAAGYLAINMVLGNLVEPALMGRGLRMSPLSIFLALVFWGWVWGPLGMILSVPLTVSIKILFENTESLKWVAALLDRRPREAR